MLGECLTPFLSGVKLMPDNSLSLESSFISAEPVHPEGAAFFAQVTEMLDGQPNDSVVVESALTGWDSVLEKMATELYRVGSMLVGEGEESIALIERAVATADIPSCTDHVAARHSGRLALAAAAIELLAKRDPTLLAAPEADSGPVSCIEDDDLSAAGVTPAELEHLLTGPDRQRLRSWLEGLTVPLRVVFVLRAVAGLSSIEIAVLLAGHGGPVARDWSPDGVRVSFRQALCSLATQMIHASAVK